ncbi:MULTISPECIES: hypothetical protein [unclassified Streptomyces]
MGCTRAARVRECRQAPRTLCSTALYAEVPQTSCRALHGHG